MLCRVRSIQGSISAALAGFEGMQSERLVHGGRSVGARDEPADRRGGQVVSRARSFWEPARLSFRARFRAVSARAVFKVD